MGCGLLGATSDGGEEADLFLERMGINFLGVLFVRGPMICSLNDVGVHMYVGHSVLGATGDDVREETLFLEGMMILLECSLFEDP